jgi:hypothetical protein
VLEYSLLDGKFPPNTTKRYLYNVKKKKKIFNTFYVLKVEDTVVIFIQQTFYIILKIDSEHFFAIFTVET